LELVVKFYAIFGHLKLKELKNYVTNWKTTN
jgi:hypothetical protein